MSERWEWCLPYSYEICGTIKVPILLHITVNVMGILLTDSALGAWIQGDIMRLGRAGYSQCLCRFFHVCAFEGDEEARSTAC